MIRLVALSNGCWNCLFSLSAQRRVFIIVSNVVLLGETFGPTHPTSNKLIFVSLLSSFVIIHIAKTHLYDFSA